VWLSAARVVDHQGAAIGEAALSPQTCHILVPPAQDLQGTSEAAAPPPTLPLHDKAALLASEMMSDYLEQAASDGTCQWRASAHRARGAVKSFCPLCSVLACSKHCRCYPGLEGVRCLLLHCLLRRAGF